MATPNSMGGSSMCRGSSGLHSNNWRKDSFFGFKKPPAARMDNNRRRTLTPAEMDEKRARGLCFFRDKKFTPGHKCKAKRHIYSLELGPIEELKEKEVDEEEDFKLEEVNKEVMEETIENCAISLQALSGTPGYQTLRLRGFTEHKPLEIFIDCGSTHNFIDEDTRVKLGCKISRIKPQLVQVADGREVPT
ncbi:hypothetical protein A4A49_15761 [Nicotiana attenuata]|uniref:Uncharacterized protein n=1 Tax=Nicotiana attenuata TaxID=49451 RepID=A0A314KMK1_NICAT|nr:hypothetical protein A4A49_15761 [Nicotiana attenuata]